MSSLNATRSTIILFLVVCVMACVIWIFDFHEPEITEVKTVDKYLLSFDPETVDRMTFTTDGGSIVCVRSNAQWLIVEPVKARVEDAAVGRILSVLEALPVCDRISSNEMSVRGLSAADYGLAPPRATMSLRCSDGLSALLVGRDSPLGDVVYVRKPGQHAVTSTSTNLLSIIPFDPNSIRTRKLLRDEQPYVVRIEIRRRGKPTILLVRRDAEWFLQSPVFARADWDKVSGMLERLFDAEIDSFVSESAADAVGYGLTEDEAALQVAYWREGDRISRKVMFGKPVMDAAGQVYATTREESSVYSVARGIADAFDVTPADLRAGTLYFMPVDSAAYLKIESPSGIIEFAKDRKGWTIKSPVKCRAEAGQVDYLLNNLNSIGILGLEQITSDDTAPELAQPDYLVTMAENVPVPSGSNDVDGAVTPGPGLSRSLAVRIPVVASNAPLAGFIGENSAYRLSPSVTNLFTTDANVYREKNVLCLSSNTVRTISLNRAGMVQSVLQRESGKWAAEVPEGGEPDVEAVAGIVGVVASGLEAKRFVTSSLKDLQAFGLDSPATVLTFGLRGEEGIQKSLLIGDVSEDLGVYARVQGQDRVFVLDKDTVQTLTRGLIK